VNCEFDDDSLHEQASAPAIASFMLFEDLYPALRACLPIHFIRGFACAF
jgi:hypothetical protein